MFNAQIYVFYFESDIAKVFPFRPTCSSYHSEILKKRQKEPKRTNKENEQMLNLDYQCTCMGSSHSRYRTCTTGTLYAH